MVPLPKYPYGFLLHLLNSSSLLDIHHWRVFFSHADIFNIPHQQLCGLNPLVNTTFSGITWRSLCSNNCNILTVSAKRALPRIFRILPVGQQRSGDLGRGWCDSVRPSSSLRLKHVPPQRDRPRRGDLQAGDFSACLLLFGFLTCLFSRCFGFKDTFSPEHVELNSGK